MPNTLEIPAPAKINLTLDVLQKLPNGYHSLEMIMQTIDIYDVLTVSITGSPEIHLHMNKELPDKIPPEKNLVYKAAKLLMDEFDIKEGLSMKLTKFIPVAAGMAGGSSDAAAAFVGVNRLFRLGLSEEELMKRAVQVGADVPYCVMRGTALAEGIGEKLTRLPGLPKCYVLVGKPGINVSTKLAYENLHLDQIQSHPDIDGMISDIENQDLHSLTAKMQNVFEPGIISQYPVIQEIKDLMEANGALKAMMSGSGPTVFGLFENRTAAREAQRRIREKSLAGQVYVTSIHGGRRN